PHLGIDAAHIRAAEGIEGTFNVCDFGEKTNWAVPHREVDQDLLVAGVSLPMLMPPVARDGKLFVDSVWIKDANPSEAVRRGAERDEDARPAAGGGLRREGRRSGDPRRHPRC